MAAAFGGSVCTIFRECREQDTQHDLECQSVSQIGTAYAGFTQFTQNGDFMNTEEFETNQPMPLNSTTVQNYGHMYTLEHSAAAREIANEYALREQRIVSMMRAPNSSFSSLTGKNIIGILDALGEGMGLASNILNMTNRPPGRGAALTFVFKNEADMIIQPFRISTTNGFRYNQAPRLMFPGESSSCQLLRAGAGQIGGGDNVSFDFAAISTDQNRAPPTANPVSIWIMIFRLQFSSRGIMSMTMYGTRQQPATIDSIGRLQYLAFVRRAGTSSPSFGVTMVTRSDNPGMGASIPSGGGVVLFTPIQR